jgi:outer membrane receptor protein involved in Fe transport
LRHFVAGHARSIRRQSRIERPDVFLDGLRIERGSTNFAYELLGLERIEVLKGPSSVLYGQGALGGASSGGIGVLAGEPVTARLTIGFSY